MGGYGVVLYIACGGDSWISAALLGEARPPRQRPCRDNIFPKEFRKHFKVFFLFKVAFLVAWWFVYALMWYSNYLFVTVGTCQLSSQRECMYIVLFWFVELCKVKNNFNGNMKLINSKLLRF